jgi:ribosomal protein uL13
MMVIDGEGCILGRMATQAAKAALKGETVRIVNAEKLIVTGKPTSIIAEYRVRINRKDSGNPLKSPRMFKRPDMLVKRTIRGMLPKKSTRGTDALKRIKAYIGVPEEFAGKGVKMGEAKELRCKALTIGEICRGLGWNG